MLNSVETRLPFLDPKFQKYLYIKDSHKFNKKYSKYLLRLVLPWNRLTYPFLALMIGYNHTKGINRKFFELLFEHLKYSFNEKRHIFENKSLRKTVTVEGEDKILRLGR